MPPDTHSPARASVSFRPGYAAPRYWGTWAALGLLWLLMWLPRRWLMALGARFGDQVRRRNHKRRRIAEVNIGLCFPELDEAARRDLVKRHFRCYGQGLIDLGLTMMDTRGRTEKYCRVEGLEHLRGIPAGRRKILVTYHTITLEMFCVSAMADLEVVSIMKRDRNPVRNWFMYRSRRRYGKARVYLRDESLRGMVEDVNRGRIGFLVPDEDFGDGRHSVFAPFFGQRRATLNIISRLARLTGAAVVPGVCRLVPETGHYVTTFGPALEDFPSGDHVRDATALNRVMEEMIRQAPEQYLWTFKWFRTREDGLPDPYRDSA